MDITGLLEAILADCDTGAMVQYTEYHISTDENGEYLKENLFLEIDYVNEFGYDEGFYISVYDDCVNTLAWLEEHNLLN